MVLYIMVQTIIAFRIVATNSSTILGTVPHYIAMISQALFCGWNK